MKILWLTWKDMEHPYAGGAELVNEEMASRLVEIGHEVIFLVAGWKDCSVEISKNGYRVIRVGNQFTVYILAFLYYRKNLSNWADIIIDECNTVPFFAKFYAKCKTVLMIQQYAREIWFYEMIFPFSLIGYLAEPIYLWLLRKETTFTFAKSTKKDLIKYGYKESNIHVLSETIRYKPLNDLSDLIKFNNPTILFFSTFRKMKRPHHVIQAFNIASNKIPNLKLVMAGGKGRGNFLSKIMQIIKNSPYSSNIEYLGPLYEEDKKRFMSKSHFICCTSIREGWGLIVTEAASQGTPAIVYNVNGLRDAVNYGSAGIITESNTPEGLAEAIVKGFLYSHKYPDLQVAALDFSRQITVDKTFLEFNAAINAL